MYFFFNLLQSARFDLIGLRVGFYRYTQIYFFVTFLQSQQDLTLLDLEPEQMSKPLSSKTRKGSQGSLGEGVVIDNVAPKEFVYQPGESLWYTTFPAALKKLNDMPPAPNKINQTKSSSGSGGDKSPEEINYAFKDSSHDVRGITNGEISNLNSGSTSSKSNISNVKTKEEPVIPPRKSRNVTKPQVKPPEPPSATKLKPSSSFSKKEKKSNVSETTDKQEVSSDNTSDIVDPASNAFDNPGLIKDWTQAVEGDSEGCSSSSSSPSRKPLLREPLSQAMDREGEENISISQYGHDYGENEDSRSLLNATERQDVDLNAAYIEHTAVPMKLNVDDANTTEVSVV